MTFNLNFRVRREYFDQILQGVKDKELRRITPYWEGRVKAAKKAKAKGQSLVGIFLCGKDVHRRHISDIVIELSARVALGRELSERGRQDVGDGPVFAFKLGNAL